jgi:hypothetical protein
MQARRRIGLGLIASGAAHLAVAALLLLAANRAPEPREGGEEDELEVVTEVQLLDAPPPTTAAATRAIEPGRADPGVVPPSSAGEPPTTRSDRLATTERPPGRGTAVERSPPRAGDGDRAPGDRAGSDEDPAAPEPDLDPRRAVEGILRDPGPTAPPGPLDAFRRRRPEKTRSELRPDGPDGFTTDEDVFVARTARDGTVAFDDRRNLQVHVPLPTPGRIARGLESWYDSLAPGRPRLGDVDRDERIPGDPGTGGQPILGGGFDLTDGVMRASGQDPYAARKIAFLDRTRDERRRLAVAARSEDLREALHRTRADLERLWRAPGPAAEKRHVLFLLWDECAESGPEEVMATSRAVRGAIVAFVRRRLPAGSADAFTDGELARENARRTSAERFEPYRRR